MRKLLAVALAALLAVQAVASENYTNSVLSILATSMGAGAGSTLAFNTANVRMGIFFMAPATCTITEWDQYVVTVTGTLTTSSAQLDIFANDPATMTPTGAAISTDTTTTAIPTAGSWLIHDGLSASVTQGTFYHAVHRNNTATPASNFFTARNTISSLEITNGAGVFSDFGRKTSTDGGATWSGASVNAASTRFKCGANWYGLPIESVTTVTGALQGVYQTREYGNVCTVPAGVSLNVAGMVHATSTTGTPTGNLRMKVYSGSTPTLVATGLTRENSNGNNNGVIFRLASPVTVSAGTWRFVLSETTQSDTVTNRYNSVTQLTIKNDSDSKGLVPWTCRVTYFDGTSWTDTDTQVHSQSIVLSSNNEATPGNITTYVPIPIE